MSKDNMEYASEARDLCAGFSHRLYVLNCEKDWDTEEARRYIPAVMGSWEVLSAVMESWRKELEEADAGG
jgi:hypothetical protein